MSYLRCVKASIKPLAFLLRHHETLDTQGVVCYHIVVSKHISASKIPENLSTLRKNLRHTQKEFAKMAGLNSNYYAKVERGDSVPSLKTLYQIAKALEVSITDIVGF